MSVKLTDEQARAIRYMSGVQGLVRCDPLMVEVIGDLITTEFAYVAVSVAGYQALAEYDREHIEEATRFRIAFGMSQAGRRSDITLNAREPSHEGP